MNTHDDHSIGEWTQPNDAQAYYSHGRAYYVKADYDRAIADFNRVIELKPNYALAYELRGKAYQKKGDHDRADADFDKAEQLRNEQQ